jgi:hypothetical protein
LALVARRKIEEAHGTVAYRSGQQDDGKVGQEARQGFL